MRPLAIALITCLALADLVGAAWLWMEWQARDQRRLAAPPVQQACAPGVSTTPAGRCG